MPICRYLYIRSPPLTPSMLTPRWCHLVRGILRLHLCIPVCFSISLYLYSYSPQWPRRIFCDRAQSRARGNVRLDRYICIYCSNCSPSSWPQRFFADQNAVLLVYISISRGILRLDPCIPVCFSIPLYLYSYSPPVAAADFF